MGAPLSTSRCQRTIRSSKATGRASESPDTELDINAQLTWPDHLLAALEGGGGPDLAPRLHQTRQTPVAVPGLCTDISALRQPGIRQGNLFDLSRQPTFN